MAEGLLESAFLISFLIAAHSSLNQGSILTECFSKKYYVSLNQIEDKSYKEDPNKLKQEDSVMEYVVKFEKLKALVLNSHPTLTESYFVTSFISGLDDAL